MTENSLRMPLMLRSYPSTSGDSLVLKQHGNATEVVDVLHDPEEFTTRFRLMLEHLQRDSRNTNRSNRLAVRECHSTCLRNSAGPSGWQALLKSAPPPDFDGVS